MSTRGGRCEEFASTSKPAGNKITTVNESEIHKQRKGQKKKEKREAKGDQYA